MKSIKYHLILFSIAVNTLAYAQNDFTGEAIYKAEIKKRNVKMDSSKLTSNLAKNS